MTAFTYRRVRKNSREFKAALANATNIKCYSLENYFSGKPVATVPYGDDVDLSHDGERYHARVHSNLWFEFTATVGA